VIRENLFILASLLAVLYSSAALYSRKPEADHNKLKHRTLDYGMGLCWLTLVAVTFCFAGFAVFEVVSGFKKIPFQYARQCYYQIQNGAWKRGQVFIEIPADTSAVTVHLQASSDVNMNVISKLNSKLFDRLSSHVYRGEVKILDGNDKRLTIQFLLNPNALIGSKEGVLVISTVGCFDSIDQKIVAAKRSLGLSIVNIEVEGKSLK
jgi:hypothetical protein